MLSGIWYLIKSALFLALAFFSVFLIQKVVTNPASSIWVMIILFFLIPTEFTQVLDLGDGWGLFAEDFTGCIVGAIFGLIVSLLIGKFVANNPGVFAGIYILIIFIARLLDLIKYFDDCSIFSNVIGIISLAAIIIMAITLFFNNHTVEQAINTPFSEGVVIVGAITWVYTVFAHAVHAWEEV
ncbi:MAG: hypothetical protein MJ054_02385 [Clostridia bacterium]|nr:hypothetical protein [Clostridia bacterium]